MEVSVINIFAVVSVIVMYFGGLKIEKIMRDANVEKNVIGKVNLITILFGVIITILSGYILFY